MKNILCWLLLALPLVLFICWVIMTLFGCIAGACNANNNFFCSSYCYIGVVLVVISVIGSCFLFQKKIKGKQVPRHD